MFAINFSQMKRLLILFASFLGLLGVLCGVFLVYFLYSFLSMFDTGISEMDQAHAVTFCRELFADKSLEAKDDYWSFDELPEVYRERAPAAVLSVNFSLSVEGGRKKCCFTSTESGNQDWGYRDCFIMENGTDSLATKVKTIGGYSECTGDDRHWHSFRGKKICIK